MTTASGSQSRYQLNVGKKRFTTADIEDTRGGAEKCNSLCPLCALCVSVVNVPELRSFDIRAKP